MAPLPKRRHSTKRKGTRRASIKLALPNLVRCPTCHELKYMHIACPHCGYFRGHEVKMSKKSVLKKGKADSHENKKRSSSPKTNSNR